MQAVILAAGRGSRFGDVTKIIPKPLIHVGNKALIIHTIDALPKAISSCVVVIGHLGDMIKSFVGKTYRGLSIEYVYQEKPGTGGALLSAQSNLKSDSQFLVVGSDDIFGDNELDKLLGTKPSYGITYGQSNKLAETEVLFDTNHKLIGFSQLTDVAKPHYFGVGAYVLDQQIFTKTMHQLPDGELSIPHSLACNVQDVRVQMIDNWLPVNNEIERIRAELRLYPYRQN